MIKVVGARGTISDVDEFLRRLLEVATEERLVIQVVNAEVVYGEEHLLSAAEHALRSFAQGTNATNSLALEILLYAAGERQITKAIKKMGVGRGRQKLAFILLDPDNRRKTRQAYDHSVEKLSSMFHLKPDDGVLQGTIDTLRRFGITDLELQTVPQEKYGDLILERVAMVDVLK
jgi:KEOPS complex subunit Cgi121